MLRSHLTTAAIFLLATLPAAAEGGSLSARYDLSIAGLPAGEAHLTAEIDGSAYKIDLQAKLGGIALVGGGGAGSATASGSMGKLRPIVAGYAVNSRTSKRQTAVQMSFSGGNAQTIIITPPATPNPNRVPVTSANKRGVVDPVSALLMPVANGDLLGETACARSLPVFDGGSRFDVPLSYVSTRTVQSNGYKGPVLVCSARYVPIAGHRNDRDDTKFMKNNRDIQVWLAPIAGTRVLAPWKIIVGTPIGQVVIQASRFTTLASATEAKAN